VVIKSPTFTHYVVGENYGKQFRVTAAQAKRIAAKFNTVVREALFKPKNAGRRARTKGHSFERAVAQAFRCVYPNARRHLEYQDEECTGVDLAHVGPFRVQCKKLKGYAPISCIEEAEHDRDFGEIPLLVTAADGKEAMAVLPLDALLTLLKDLKRDSSYRQS